MNTLEQIQEQLRHLPPGKQGEVLEFISLLQRQLSREASANRRRSLREHPAFGSWAGRGIDAVDFQESMRSEWDERG